MSVAMQFARNIQQFYRRALPAETFERARYAIIDTLGVTLAGSLQPGARKLRAVIEPTAAAGNSRVFGTDSRLNALDAALLNGIAAHMLDFDDSNSRLHGHTSVAILPALLALADERQAPSAAVTQAYITGFEAASRLGDAVGRHQYTHGWHPTTTIGLFAAVAACSALLELDESQTATALSIATALACGIKSNFGSETKPLGVGHANRNALLAVKLAQQDFSAGEQAFEHHHGYFKVFNSDAENYDVSPLVSPWVGEPVLLDRVKGIKQKRFPCCYAILPPLDGVLSLRHEHQLTPASIARIIIGVHPIRFPHINVPTPASPLAAKFSLHYCVARTLENGQLTLDDFIDESRFARPDTQRLMQRVTLFQYQRDNIGGAEVSIETHDGRLLTTYIDSAQGSSYNNPLPPSLNKEKFLQCATPALGESAALALYHRLNQGDFA
ncbi:MmgE/PrpD family protein [Brenneria tiliae]|uniref:MmgE/PrpD family protein n=1 Tax=Brenneria tiliae TaxID=2914984 RepID=UPI002014C207|nr:MmgE/PrpD family protein [Brenneria tiliae]MCL2896937.1 MmgE/PrpD family protein [Brenneria tiliae]MCL2901495.1 MmgE/PrpD family protein [Brenneria tiliae]